MSHLDEGQLHALLDGELDEAERKAVEAHLESCPECSREYAEARAFMAGADQLIAAVELPASTRPRAVAPKARTPLFRWRNVAWAASLVLAVGIGWLSRAERRVESASDAARIGAVTAESPAPQPPLMDSGSLETKQKQEETARTELQSKRAGDQKAAQPGPTAEHDEAAKVAGGLAAAPAKPESPPPAAMASGNAPVTSTDALRALTNPTDKGKDAEEIRRDAAPVASEDARLAKKTEPQQPAVNLAEAPVGTSQAIPQALPKESVVQGYAAPQGARPVRRERADAFHATPMEAAVRILGGSIRLVDGMTPTQVLVGPGNLVGGADPALEIVRVVYDDPPGRELWLDQQRPAATSNELAGQGKGATTLLPGDTLVSTYRGGQRGLRWIHQTGFRLGLTGFLPADSLRALARRVQ